MKSKRSSKARSQIPEVNLVPMMDVLMTVLTFFIIISMSLTGQQILSVQLPETEQTDSGGAAEEEAIEPMVVGLNADGEILIADEPIDEAELATAMTEYLNENPDGYVRLKADRELDYDDVAQLLVTMRDIGGARVSLAIE